MPQGALERHRASRAERPSPREVGRRSLLTLARQLLLRETLLQDAGHLPGLHAELRADLLGPESVLLRLDEQDDLVELLRDVLGRAARQAPVLPGGLRRSRQRVWLAAAPRRRAGATAMAGGARPVGDQLLERSAADGFYDLLDERVGEGLELCFQGRHGSRD